MTDFSEAYDSITDQINTYVSTQVSSETVWNNIPGGLDKVSASSMGFAWGVGGGKLYICHLPCSGDWKEVDIPCKSIWDFTTDDSHVYVLCDGDFFIKAASNVDNWIKTSGPKSTAHTLSLFSSGSYIWAQDSSNTKYRIAKPGTTGNWSTVNDPLKIKITSASTTTLYGIDASGSAMKSDETLQTGWAVVPDFGTKVSKVFGGIDESAVYGLDTTNQLKRCADGKCATVETKGLTPNDVSFDPLTKGIWMTTQTPGSAGNVFFKQDSTNTGNIYAITAPLDKQRDTIVTSAEQQFQDNTHTGIMMKQVELMKKYLSSMLPKKTVNQPKLRGNVIKTSAELEQLQKALPAVQWLLLLLLIILFVYLVLSWIGFMVHIVAACILGGGLYFLYTKQ